MTLTDSLEVANSTKLTSEEHLHGCQQTLHGALKFCYWAPSVLSSGSGLKTNSDFKNFEFELGVAVGKAALRTTSTASLTVLVTW